MKKAGFVLGILILALVIFQYTQHWFVVEAPKPVDINSFQQLVIEKSRQITNTAERNTNWANLLESVSSKYGLGLELKTMTVQQVELAVSEAEFEDMVNAFAELYAQGIRFQSIRLLKTDTQGMVRADSIRLINTN